MSLVVREATADEVRPLRLGVLRPHAPVVPAAYDLEPDTVHIGAFDGTTVVGCATVFPEPFVHDDPPTDDPKAWRLRGMAVAPDRQGQGIGRLVLEAATAAAAQRGAPLLWANGRVTAMSFYQRLGWEAVGEVFSYGPANLAHLVIVRRLAT
jgi:GNAT superfamily N-acetyltransferase